MNHPPLNSQGIAEWRNNKASAANDGFRWQFMVKNDHPNGVYSGKQGDESSPRLSKVRGDMKPIFEEGVFKGGLVPVQLTGWKIHHCTQSAMWIVQENLRSGQKCFFKNSFIVSELSIRKLVTLTRVFYLLANQNGFSKR